MTVTSRFRPCRSDRPPSVYPSLNRSIEKSPLSPRTRGGVHPLPALEHRQQSFEQARRRPTRFAGAGKVPGVVRCSITGERPTATAELECRSSLNPATCPSAVLRSRSVNQRRNRITTAVPTSTDVAKRRPLNSDSERGRSSPNATRPIDIGRTLLPQDWTVFVTGPRTPSAGSGHGTRGACWPSDRRCRVAALSSHRGATSGCRRRSGSSGRRRRGGACIRWIGP